MAKDWVPLGLRPRSQLQRLWRLALLGVIGVLFSTRTGSDSFLQSPADVGRRDALSAGLSGAAILTPLAAHAEEAASAAGAVAEAAAPSPVEAAPAVKGADGFYKTESGIKYETLRAGTGRQPKLGEYIKVRITGWLYGFGGQDNGAQFLPVKQQATYAKDDDLAPNWVIEDRQVGSDDNLKCQNEMLLDMKEGEVRKFVSPPELGYGDNNRLAFIPPNSTLFYQVQLMKIREDAPPPQFRIPKIDLGFPDIPGVIRVLGEMAQEEIAKR
eukprot:TRINITY_DN23075_c0_g1_i1.p1 TRINITY_DN23075_c0_g1~~TRINITY_DN23075_c0_g1_i1.p1  ORF type:complete len:270 (-),score=39.92 TRINITY_DN23075_c0_g1_i1:465-1274(-)